MNFSGTVKPFKMGASILSRRKANVPWDRLSLAVQTGLNAVGIEPNRLNSQQTANGMVFSIVGMSQVLLIPRLSSRNNWEGEIEIHRWYTSSRCYEFQMTVSTVDGVVSAVVLGLITQKVSQALSEAGLDGMLQSMFTGEDNRYVVPSSMGFDRKSA